MREQYLKWVAVVLMLSMSLVNGFAAHAAKKNNGEPELEKLSAKELAQLELKANEARNLYSAGNYVDAESILKEIAERFTVSQPLYRCELAMCLLAQGKNDEAHSLLLKSYEDLLEFFDPKSEKKAVRIWGKEGKKVYKGDPYEQATLCLLLGALFLEEGDIDNALPVLKVDSSRILMFRPKNTRPIMPFFNFWKRVAIVCGSNRSCACSCPKLAQIPLCL